MPLCRRADSPQRRRRAVFRGGNLLLGGERNASSQQRKRRALQLADIQWQESDNGYTANATYAGSAISKSATGYTVTANYVGQVAKTISGEIIYTAVFSGTPVGSGGAAMLAEGGNFAWLLALLLAAVIGGTLYGGRILIRKRNAKKEWREYTK